MTTQGWTWANLSGDQLKLVAEAERSLSADYLLAYQPTEHSSRPVEARVRGLRTAPLTESEIESLQGLESQLQAVVIAYADKS